MLPRDETWCAKLRRRVRWSRGIRRQSTEDDPIAIYSLNGNERRARAILMMAFYTAAVLRVGIVTTG